MRREISAIVGMAVVLAILMTWPLVLHLGEIAAGPANLADPMLEAWTVAWDGHALLHAPAHVFDANAFWPLHDSLAFSESLLGLAPAGVVGHGTHAAVVRYDLLFLFADVVAFVGAYALARALGAGLAGATFAGAAFAYAPFRLAHESHLHVLESGGIPLSLALLIRGYRDRSSRAVVAGWLVALWQVSLGWNLGLPFVYLLGLLGLGAVTWWWRRGRPTGARSVVVATIAGSGAFMAGTVFLALVYVRVLNRHPEARRTPDILFFFSPRVRSLGAAPERDTAWGAVTAPLRLDPTEEKSLFVGAVVLVLAAIGLIYGRQRPALRIGLAVGAVVCAVLSLGFGLHGGRYTYRLVYDYLPGWQGLRTPGRLVTFTSLSLVPLAAFGADRVTASVRRFGPLASVTVASLLVLFALIEGYGKIGRAQLPPPPRAFASAPPPRLLLPADQDDTNAEAMFWSIGAFRSLANGWSGFHPATYSELIAAIRGFPDRPSVRRLRAYGIRTVILNREEARGTSWQDAGARPVRGLPLRKRFVGAFVVFDIGGARP
jgi:hypothetical protein